MPLIDTLSVIRGAHSLKFGAEYRAIRLQRDSFAGTTYTFNSITDLLSNTPSSIAFNADLGAPSPWTGGRSGPRHLQDWYLVGYGQDEWRLSKQVTLNYGMRYEYYAPMRERDNREVLFNTVTGQLDTPGSRDWYQTSSLAFAPRLGLSYSPEKLAGKTVFRMGGGFFYGPGQPEDLIQPAESDRVSRTLSSGAFPIVPADIISGYDINSTSLKFQPRAYAPGYKVPERIMSYTASLQQELPGGAVLSVAYVGSLGRNLFLRSVANKITGVATNATTGAAIVTREFGDRFAEIDYKTSGGNDHYHSMQTTINRRFSKGLTFGLQHTWGRSIGNSPGFERGAHCRQQLQLRGGLRQQQLRHPAQRQRDGPLGTPVRRQQGFQAYRRRRQDLRRMGTRRHRQLPDRHSDQPADHPRGRCLPR